jgi:transposase
MGRNHSREFKFRIVRALISGEKSLAQICREHSLAPSMVSRWRDQYNEKGAEAFPGTGAGSRVAESEAERVAALEASLGRAHLEIEFLKAVIKKKDSLPPRGEP